MATPLPFPEPAWLAGYADPVVDLLLEDLDDDEWRRLYRVYLADEVRAERPAGIFPPAWHAFVRAGEDIRRRNREARRA